MQISDLSPGSQVHHLHRGLLTIATKSLTTAIGMTSTGVEVAFSASDIDVTVGAAPPIIIWPNNSDRVATARKLIAALNGVLA